MDVNNIIRNWKVWSLVGKLIAMKKDDHKGQIGHKKAKWIKSNVRDVDMLPDYAHKLSKVLLEVNLKD